MGTTNASDSGNSAPTVVATAAGPITLVELPALKARLASLQAQSTNMSAQARSLRTLADDRYAELGAAQLSSSPPTQAGDQLAAQLDQARALRIRLDADNETLETIKGEDRHGVAGLFGKIGASIQARRVTGDRSDLERQLRPLLVSIGQQVAEPQADSAVKLRDQGQAAGVQAKELEAQTRVLAGSIHQLETEVQAREQAQKEMGFDAPYLAAYLQTYGPQPVQSPLNIKRGERALATMPAHLARNQTRTHWVGGSQGFSFPIGHTGIRYRVGSYHGHPVPQQFLGTLDTGTLVITDQRVAFIGRLKSTSCALNKLVHVQCYSDALALFQEGRENPDYFIVTQPKYALFMINWAEAQT